MALPLDPAPACGLNGFFLMSGFFVFILMSVSAAFADCPGSFYENVESINHNPTLEREISFSTPSGKPECWRQRSGFKFDITYGPSNGTDGSGSIEIEVPVSEFNNNFKASESAYLHIAPEEGLPGGYRVSALSAICYEDGVLSTQAVEGLFVVDRKASLLELNRHLGLMPSSGFFEEVDYQGIDQSIDALTVIGLLGEYTPQKPLESSVTFSQGSYERVIIGGIAGRMFAKAQQKQIGQWDRRFSPGVTFNEVAGYVPAVFAELASAGGVVEDGINHLLGPTLDVNSSLGLGHNAILHSVQSGAFNPNYICTKGFKKMMAPYKIGPGWKTNSLTGIRFQGDGNKVSIQW